MNRQELIEMYDDIHQEGNYGMGTARDENIMDFFNDNLRTHLPETIDVLDASCGGGSLLRLLGWEMGITAYGTEVAPCLLESHLKCMASRIALLSYEDLPKHPRRFDVIFSNDVLEHLHDEEQALTAIKNFREMAPCCVISLSTRGAKSWPRRMKLPVRDLHTLQRPPKWWFRAFQSQGWKLTHKQKSRPATLMMIGERE